MDRNPGKVNQKKGSPKDVTFETPLPSFVSISTIGTGGEYVNLRYGETKSMVSRSTVNQMSIAAIDRWGPTESRVTVASRRDLLRRHGFRAVHTFDLEAWWVNSMSSQRLVVALAVFCFAMFLLQFVAGLAFIIKGSTAKRPDPYKCTSVECNKAALWLNKSMDESVNPCDNFYEFVCGGVNGSHEETMLDPQFSYLSTAGYPAYRGENSVIAKILAGYTRNGKKIDKKTIKYYQACLHSTNRKKFGMTAFFDAMKEIFGSQKFSEFESSGEPLEQITARMLRTAGHASFLNFAFSAYPFIEIQRPSSFVAEIHEQSVQDGNEGLVKLLAVQLMEELGVDAGSSIITDVVQGIKTMSLILDHIKRVFRSDNHFTSARLDKVINDAKFLNKMNIQFFRKGLCPPMGINLDVDKVLHEFLKEDFRLSFADLTAVKSFAAMKLCLTRNPMDFTHKKIIHKKTAFVSLWLVQMFFQFVKEMDSLHVLNNWGITPHRFPNSTLVEDHYMAAENELEYSCVESVYGNLGNVPLIQYMFQIAQDQGERDPAIYTNLLEENIVQKIFHDLARHYSKSSDVPAELKHLGSIQFARGIHSEFGMSWVSGFIHESSINDDVNMTDDHLRNSLEGMKLIIEKARMNWIGATNPDPIIRWFGYGGGREQIKDDLLDFRNPMIRPAPFREIPFPANGQGQWETFLYRKYPNYILYPATLIAQPHVSLILSFYIAQMTRTVARSLLHLIESQSPKYKYASFENRSQMLNTSLFQTPVLKRQCFVYGTKKLITEKEVAHPINIPVIDKDTFQLEFIPIMSTDFIFNNIRKFHNMLSLRYGLLDLRHYRNYYQKNLSINWVNLQDEINRAYAMNHRLPGKMSKYSEDQIYFIATVRQYCRGSWKNHPLYRRRRWIMEMNILNMLTQTKEFAETFNCPKNSFMNNKGLPRCFGG